MKRLYADDDVKGVPLFDAMQEVDELRALTVWKVHTLSGDRKGAWSLSVTGNHRLTFTIEDEREICDVNLEDYH